MNTVKLNITLPTSVNDDINSYAKKLNVKKNHLIISALEMYFNYLDSKKSESKINNPLNV